MFSMTEKLELFIEMKYMNYWPAIPTEVRVTCALYIWAHKWYSRSPLQWNCLQLENMLYARTYMIFVWMWSHLRSTSFWLRGDESKGIMDGLHEFLWFALTSWGHRQQANSNLEIKTSTLQIKIVSKERVFQWLYMQLLVATRKSLSHVSAIMVLETILTSYVWIISSSIARGSIICHGRNLQGPIQS